MRLLHIRLARRYLHHSASFGLLTLGCGVDSGPYEVGFAIIPKIDGFTAAKYVGESCSARRGRRGEGTRCGPVCGPGSGPCPRTVSNRPCVWPRFLVGASNSAPKKRVPYTEAPFFNQ